ncbi:phospholipase D-like protein [Trichococcus patagoniensis]|uniref:Phospholipase D-like protein n=1 Tax=Trichococcus patagoniensis TaxID=382641 RepID=A0A2T5IHI6_9LACT|nr:PLD nuclease N-terminal domain-containing protein [Trichococcus patagoniensis]PTQ83278.1 phospholipase D-like protein [Trichococcus patagoniensis]
MIADLQPYLPILIPLVVIQIILLITALLHLNKHPNVKTGSKTLWTFIIIFLNIVGPVLYFLIGRGDE